MALGAGLAMLAADIVLTESMRRGIASLRPVVTVYEEVQNMQTLIAEWTDANGISHTVETRRGSGESMEAFQTRHDEAVASMVAKYPPA